MSVIYRGKVPVVVPRRKKYGEHVDDHQVYFTRKLEEKRKIIAVHDMQELEEKIRNYYDTIKRLKHAEKINLRQDDRVSFFAQALDEICERLIRKEKI
jgi:UDP-N-acetylglucosamine transferase subunit ALG13